MAHRSGALAGVVWCNYGQPACLQEWRALRGLLKSLGVEAPLHEVPLTTVCAGDMLDATGEPGPRVVVARNMLMLAHAANWAAHIGASTVWYGATRDDWDHYPDCRPRFIEALNHCLLADGVQVAAPLNALRKSDILARAVAEGVPVELCWSCYTPKRSLQGDVQPCGTCDSCRARTEAA